MVNGRVVSTVKEKPKPSSPPASSLVKPTTTTFLAVPDSAAKTASEEKQKSSWGVSPAFQSREPSPFSISNRAPRAPRRSCARSRGPSTNSSPADSAPSFAHTLSQKLSAQVAQQANVHSSSGHGYPAGLQNSLLSGRQHQAMQTSVEFQHCRSDSPMLAPFGTSHPSESHESEFSNKSMNERANFASTLLHNLFVTKDYADVRMSDSVFYSYFIEGDHPSRGYLYSMPSVYFRLSITIFCGKIQVVTPKV